MKNIVFLLLITLSSCFKIANEDAELTGNPGFSERSTFVISGKCIWEGNRLGIQSGVSGVLVILSGAESDSVTTGADGLYSFTVSTPGDYTITPKKNRPPPLCVNGVTASDAFRIQQHVLGAFLINDPYKVIAADANKSNTVTAADASYVVQAVIGNPVVQGFFAANTWGFVPSSYVFPNALQPWSAPDAIQLIGVSTNQSLQNFIALKLGDVNSTANPSL